MLTLELRWSSWWCYPLPRPSCTYRNVKGTSCQNVVCPTSRRIKWKLKLQTPRLNMLIFISMTAIDAPQGKLAALLVTKLHVLLYYKTTNYSNHPFGQLMVKGLMRFQASSTSKVCVNVWITWLYPYNFSTSSISYATKSPQTS